MKSNRKGNKLETEAMEVYNSLGFQTWKAATKKIKKKRKDGGTYYISLQQDIAGVFDFIAWDDEEVHLVQVKSSESHASEARKKINNSNMSKTGVTQVVLMRIHRKKHHFIAWVLLEDGKWDRQEFNESRMVDGYRGYDITEE